MSKHEVCGLFDFELNIIGEFQTRKLPYKF